MPSFVHSACKKSMSKIHVTASTTYVEINEVQNDPHFFDCLYGDMQATIRHDIISPLTIVRIDKGKHILRILFGTLELCVKPSTMITLHPTSDKSSYIVAEVDVDYKVRYASK